MIDTSQNKGDQGLHYDINKWKIKGVFDIINDIIEHVPIVNFIDKIVNMNHAVSIALKCIFDLK